ncbi:MAG: hypothetical protein HOP08_18385 [Cyclobacteriaceae bacterium]|nr:hypothetical protein [Cyclobacteriaceae bacterium]
MVWIKNPPSLGDGVSGEPGLQIRPSGPTRHEQLLWGKRRANGGGESMSANGNNIFTGTPKVNVGGNIEGFGVEAEINIDSKDVTTNAEAPIAPGVAAVTSITKINDRTTVTRTELQVGFSGGLDLMGDLKGYTVLGQDTSVQSKKKK